MTQQPQTPTAAVTTPTDREIHIERVFDAPRDPGVRDLHRPDAVRRPQRPARLDELLARLASGTSHSTASGGRTSSAEKGCSPHGIGSASTHPRLPAFVPP